MGDLFELLGDFIDDVIVMIDDYYLDNKINIV